MKRTILLSLVTLLCLPVAVYATSIGGAETQGQGKFSIGLDQEFVFDRDMELKSIDPEPADDPGETFELKSEIDKMYRTMVKTSYGVLDNLDVYVKLGMADFEDKASYDYTEPGFWETGSLKVKGDNAFAYGFGVKGTYNLEDDWIVGCDIQYLRHENDYRGTESWEDSDGDSGEESYKGEVTFEAWHVAPYIAKRLNNFVPYLGVRYSDLTQKYELKWEDGEKDKIKFEADDNFGVFLGTDYKINDVWSLNLEGRFVDETAISFGGTYRF